MAASRRQIGDIFVWLSAMALGLVSTMTVGLIVIVLMGAIGCFWPSDLNTYTMTNGQTWIAADAGADTHNGATQIRLHVANRDINGFDFLWVPQEEIATTMQNQNIIALERMEYGIFQGILEQPSTLDQVEQRLDAHTVATEPLHELQAEIAELAEQAEQLREDIAIATYNDENASELQSQLDAINQQFEAKQSQGQALEQKLAQASITMQDGNGQSIEIALSNIVRIWQPNTMNIFGKVGFYLAKIVEMLTEEPRESNTEGGIFPALFGTILMVMLMSMFTMPFGVLAAIYLREYAKDGPFVRFVRISVNNLSGVPSIVYGVFGLGFFIYGVGGTIDSLFFAHALPTPTYGTGGILWASLTLALLTVPVVIVSTEEALSAIPNDIRSGARALGATQWQTLVRVIVPMATPGMITGFVLAMARAAGEVAPLMLTGAVKLAPELPLDGVAPFLHLDRKFMHLGFHIYDLAFQSPNVESVLPMVYVTTALLLTVVILLSGTAIWLRNSLRKKFAAQTF